VNGNQLTKNIIIYIYIYIPKLVRHKLTPLNTELRITKLVTLNTEVNTTKMRPPENSRLPAGGAGGGGGGIGKTRAQAESGPGSQRAEDGIGRGVLPVLDNSTRTGGKPAGWCGTRSDTTMRPTGGGGGDGCCGASHENSRGGTTTGGWRSSPGCTSSSSSRPDST
jgi:hypothetical protein